MVKKVQKSVYVVIERPQILTYLHFPCIGRSLNMHKGMIILAAPMPKTAWVTKDQLRYKTILAMSPVVPKSFDEGSNENLDSEMTIV